MANHKRKRPRGKTKSIIQSMSGWPIWHDLFFHIRPKRRASKAMLHAIKTNQLDPENAALPLGNHKPHKYYW